MGDSSLPSEPNGDFRSEGWEEIASRKRVQRDHAIEAWQQNPPSLPPTGTTCVQQWPLESRALSARDVTITEALPSFILRMASTGAWTAEEITSAFINRTIIAHYLTNPLTEVLFERGHRRAQELDQYRTTHGKTVGPLHGLPISLKDVFDIKGVDTTEGFVAWCGRQPTRSDALVEKLEEAGAIIYCKTNIPQTLMSGECVNFIFGRTSTPYNTNLTAGGSSGGEGSLVSLGGSPLGIGTDIAGSIRTPANYNGIFGLCPSFGRFPIHNPGESLSLWSIRGVAGPISRSVDGLEVYVKSLLALKPWEWDSTIVQLPWNQEAFEEGLGLKQKLCFGIIPDDRVVTPHPPIQRGLRETAEALRVAGHDVVEVPFFENEGLGDKMMKLFKSDGGEMVKKIVSQSKEPLIEEIMQVRPEDALSTYEFLEASRDISALRQKYLDKWRSTGTLTPSGRPVDAFILPSGGELAPPHGTFDYYPYEALSNLLDWTCATIPVGFIDRILDVIKPEHKFVPMSDDDAKMRSKCRLLANLAVPEYPLT